tara:strand:- start:7200 stop:8420 length:1221 start_codon:yes stop_codon:yes gene_type:complete
MIKAGIDIGNSKITCVVADCKNIDNINILSLISIPTNYVKKNVILNYDGLFDQIKTLIHETEINSQTKLNSINLNISLLNSRSHYYDSDLEIRNEKISELHLKKIINQSEYFNVNDYEFEVLNTILSYDIDNIKYFTAPLGNFSDKIKINFYKILIQKKYIENFSSLLKKLKLNIENYVPSPLASSLSSLTSDEKELGTICINFGHSTTSISIFDNNKFIFGDTLGVGSNNITLDIARGVSTSISSAERLKTLYGSLLSSPSDEHEIIEIPIISGEKNIFNQITRSNINMIIKPRIEETIEILWQRIKDNNLRNKKIKNVVITGGGSQLDNIEKYVETIFASSTRIAKPLDSFKLQKDYNNPSFCDTIGSILFDPNFYELNFLNKNKKKTKIVGISRFFNWIDQYI